MSLHLLDSWIEPYIESYGEKEEDLAPLLAEADDLYTLLSLPDFFPTYAFDHTALFLALLKRQLDYWFVESELQYFQVSFMEAKPEYADYGRSLVPKEVAHEYQYLMGSISAGTQAHELICLVEFLVAVVDEQEGITYSFEKR